MAPNSPAVPFRRCAVRSGGLNLFASVPDITLVHDGPSADAILGNVRVLMDPILSGSGITAKLIDMLCNDAPIVTIARVFQ